MNQKTMINNNYSVTKLIAFFSIFLCLFFVSNIQIVSAEGRWKGDGNGGCYWDPVDTGPDQCDPNSNGGNGNTGSNSSWRQDIQYSISESGGVVGYYNVKTNGNKVFDWNVDVTAFNGPDTMHVVTIGAYDDTAGSSGTTAHGFSVPASGKVDYRNPPESGKFNFSYDTRYRTCGRVQIDGSFIDELTGGDEQLFFATVIDYGVDCVEEVNQKPVINLLGSNPVTVYVGDVYLDAGATATDPEDGNITADIVKTGTVNTALVGTYTLTYNVSDSKGLSALPVTRTVNVVLSPINNRPVITLIGSSTVNVLAGSLYIDAGATASDIEDGNITANIVRTGTVNTSVVGTSTVTYNVSDSKGLAAVPVTRTVIVTSANQKPVITLVGLNPTTILVGTTYIDAGATAFDPEDGNITAKIATTTTVNSSVVGTYTVKYNVSDSQGLAAFTVTRTVDVVPKVNSCDVVRENGWYSKYYNYASTTLGMEMPIENWSDTYGDPLSKNSIWTANWYDNAFYRFTRTDANLNFGDNFFPFDSNPEEMLGDHDYHFGLYSSALVTATTTGNYAYTSTSDDDLWVYVDGNLLVDNNGVHVPLSKNGNIHLTAGTHVVDVYFAERHVVQSYLSFEFVDKSLDIKTNNPCIVVNNRPVITLVGLNPASVNLGSTYIDPGATALDQEDGDITSHIVATSTVNTAVVGTYTVTYNVSDSKGLAAIPVSRTVNVLDTNTGGPKGQITFCLMLADAQNTIATSSVGLPTGVFTMNLGTTTNVASTLVQTKVWNISTFTANTKLILAENDANCVTYSDLNLGTYYYSTSTVNGAQWNTPKYNDKYNQTLNNVFDFFNFSPELFTATTTDDSLRNMNADGQVVLDSSNLSRSVNVYVTYNPAPQCLLPQITSPLTATVTVNNPFTYTLTASSSINSLSVATTSLPSGLSFSTTTNSISGTPTQTGTFNIDLTAVNNCGTTTAMLAITVSAGGGGGSSPTSNIGVTKVADKATLGVGETLTYTVTVINNGPDNATGVKLVENFPGNLNIVSATSTLGSYSTTTNLWTIGNLLNGSSTTLTLVGTVKTGTEGQTITNSVTVSADQSDPNTTNNTTSVDTKVNPAIVPPCTNCGGGGGGGGNGPIVGSYGGGGGSIVTPAPTPVPNACYYLYDYLRKDFNNNPVEVTKLQIFLRDLEGFTNLQITGVYDDQTIVALNAFQDRYKDDILTPWGHNAPTAYTYILTKKKVNEIYCKTAFPVNAQQQDEIDSYRNFLMSLRNAGITLPSQGNILPVTGTSTEPIPVELGPMNNVGSATTTDGQTTLAGVSTTTRQIVSNLTANVISAGRAVATAIQTFFSRLFGTTNQCITGFGWLNLLLLLVIAIVSYLWYKEYRNNKVIEKINEEIDLEK